MRGFKPDMTDAVETEPTAYASFNEFFTRALRAGTRPVDADPHAIVSPVDGTVSEAGVLTADRLLQAKGHEYSLRALLAGNAAWERTFAGGIVRDYLPGALQLSPHPHAARRRAARELLRARAAVQREPHHGAAGARTVLAQRARVLRLRFGRHAVGPVILVGALNVGSMATVWHGDVTPRKLREVTALPVSGVLADHGAAPRATEMARFNMGSTVILLFPPGAADWDGELEAGQTLRMGERIGTLRGWHPGSGSGGG